MPPVPGPHRRVSRRLRFRRPDRPVTRDVTPDAVADLATAPPRATLAWVADSGAVEAAPVQATFDAGSWQVDGPQGRLDARLEGHEVVLVLDDGPGWFQLRALLVRGPARLGPDRRSVHVRPRRVVAWNYGALRPTNDHSLPAGGRPAAVSPSPGSRTDDRPAAPLSPRAARRVVGRARVLLLATASSRGRPFCVPLWFVHHRGRFWIATGAESWSARNAAANPDVCLLLGGERRQPRTRVHVAGQAVCRAGLPPAAVLARLAVRYYLAPRRALVEVRHARQWPLRQRYYRQTAGGAAYLVVTPSAVDVLP